MRKKYMLHAFLFSLVMIPYASADQVRQITPVDENGNPTGETQTIIIPDIPDSSATGHMVDQDGNQTTPDFQIPDAVQPESVPDSSDMVPETPDWEPSNG